MKKLKSIKSKFPIKNIENGIIETKDGRFCKVLEISPVNFEFKSNSEKEVIIAQYKAFLKTCNFDIQILVQSKKNDLEKHLEKLKIFMEAENSLKVKQLIENYINMIRENTLKSTVTRKFFLVFCAEVTGSKKLTKDMAINDLNEKTAKVMKTLEKCGNSIKDFSDNNFEAVNNLYRQLNRKTSEIQGIEVILHEKV